MVDIITKVMKRNGKVTRYDEHKITEAIFRAAAQEHGKDRKTAAILASKVTSYLSASFKDSLPNVEDIQDIVEYTLKINGHIRTAEAYMIYRAGRAGVRAGLIAENCFVPDGVPRLKIDQVKRWNNAHKCETIAQLNEWIESEKFEDLMNASIVQYENDVTQAADMILKRPDIRLVIVAGPSSSGKTTTTCKLGERLARYGKKLKTLNVDNYFHSLDEYEVDEFGDRDFERPEALRIDLINEHLSRLLKGETVKIPFYDFKQGKRFDEKQEFSVKPNEIILLDSLHGLYPRMTAAVPDEQKFRLYIGTFNVLKDLDGNFTRWTDIRLLRRMLRDRDHRNHPIDETLGHWHYVRNSELKHIIPYINTTNYIVNGGLAFELPVLKNHMGDDFPDPKQFEGDPKRIDAYLRAVRIRKLLESVKELKDTSIIPKDSHLREFIGGSVYEQH